KRRRRRLRERASRLCRVRARRPLVALRAGEPEGDRGGAAHPTAARGGAPRRGRRVPSGRGARIVKTAGRIIAGVAIGMVVALAAGGASLAVWDSRPSPAA